jgi:uncharacterized protein YndB with AHSA1/START domain
MTDILKEFEIVREYSAPREKVFKAWTDPQLVAQWWGPEGVFTPVCEVDARVGGAIHIVMEAGESLGDFKGTQWPMDGLFEEVQEPSKLVFSSSAVNNGKELFKHVTTVTFEEISGKTRMTVHVAVTEIYENAEFAIGGMEQGWNSQFDKLGTFLSGV